MTSEKSKVDIITPLRNEDQRFESVRFTTDDETIASDISEHATISPSHQNNSSKIVSSRLTENFIFIWLNLNTTDANENPDDSITKLQHIVDSIKLFQDSNECIDYLTDIEYEQIFIIISGSPIQHLVSLIEDIPKLRSIYILDSQSTNDEQWSEEHRKVKGIFTEIDGICDILKKDIYGLMIDLTPISIISPTNSTNLNELDQSFMYTQLLKEIILHKEQDPKVKKEFVDFLRIIYENNPTQLNTITEFDQDYNSHSPIWWYTKQWFLYSELNKALRTQDVEVIIRMGFFLQDLHREIERKYTESPPSSKLIVYRGQGMSKVDFAKLQKNEGGLLSFNNFLSTSLDRQVSFIFAESIQLNSDLMGILFQIEIDPSVSTTPYTALGADSQFEREEEILFSMHTIFRINQIEELDNRLWKVKLTLTSDNDPQLKHLIDCQRHEIGGTDGWFSMGFLMQKMGKLDKALEVYKTLLEITVGDDLNIQNALRVFARTRVAEVHRSMGDYSDAIKHLEQVIDICENSLSSNHQVLAFSYDGIASVYLSTGNYSMALTYYEKALSIWEKTLPSDHACLLTIYSHIALTHHSIGHYSLALSYYEKIHQVQQKNLPFNHPNIAANEHNIGVVHYSMGNYITALSSFEKALEINEKTLPPDHLDLALNYNHISAIHTAMGNLAMAIAYAEKALDVQKSGSANHPNLAIAYSNIAAVHTTAGNYMIALSYFEKAIDIYRQKFPADHPDLAKVYSNVGGLHRLMNNHATALTYYEKALGIFQKALPLDHSDWVMHYTSVGYLYQAIGNYSTALSYMEKAFKIAEKSLLSDHPNLATSYYVIATIYESMGNYPLALSNYKKAHDMYQKMFTPNHSDLAIIKKRIAWLSLSTTDLLSVLSNLNEAFEIEQKHLSINHTSSVRSSDDVEEMHPALDYRSTSASQFMTSVESQQKLDSSNATNQTSTLEDAYASYQVLKDLEASLLNTEKMIENLRHSPWTNHPMFSGVFHNANDRNIAIEHYSNSNSSSKQAVQIMLEWLDSCREETSSHRNETEILHSIEEHQSAALLHMEKYFQVIQTNLPGNDAFLAGAYNNMGASLINAKNYSIALSYFEKALELLHSSSSNNHSMLAMTYSNIAKVYDALGDDDKAADYTSRAIYCQSNENMRLNDGVLETNEDELQRQ